MTLPKYSRVTPRLLSSVAAVLAGQTKRYFHLSKCCHTIKFHLPDLNVTKGKCDVC